MNKANFNRVSEFLKGQEANLERHERGYKLEGAAKARQELAGFLENNLPKVRQLQPKPLNLLDWRIVDGVSKMIQADPDVFRLALKDLWETRDADGFWDAIDPNLDALPDVARTKFKGARTRASVASYFLFVQGPEHYPFYRFGFGEKAIRFIYGDPLDDRSLNDLLRDYVGRCDYLRRRFQDEGIVLHDALDLQGALYLVSTELL